MSGARYCQLAEVQEDTRPPRGGREAEGPAARDPRLSTVQFSAPIFYADQAEGAMSIDVIRTGATGSRAAAKYRTGDVSAKAGEIYEAVSGEVVFEPGETLQTVVVPLIHSGVWSATVEFNVLLSEPRQCNLGVYLWECRVKVIDDGAFPSSRFRRELAAGNARGVPGASLFWEYFKWSVRSAKLLSTILLVVAMDQLKNANMILLLYCDMYLVNIVCNPEAPAERLLLPSHERTACLVAALHVVPLLVLYLSGLAKLHLDVRGYCALHLQRSVYRKFMNLSHLAVSGELDVRIRTDCPKLAGGLQASIDILEVFANVGMHVYFIVAKNPKATPLALSLPAVIVAWASFRALCFQPIGTAKETASMVDHVHETNGKSDLVQTFFLRPQMNADFAKLAVALEAKGVKKAVQETTTHFGLHWVAPVFIGIYIAAMVQRVLDQEVRVGTFLATIAVMKNMSQLTVTACSAVMDLVHSFPALYNLSDFLNLETELGECKAANRLKRESTGALGLSEVAVVCQDAAFSFEGGVEILAHLSATAVQGKIVEVRGAHHSGKSTLMRLLGQQIRPTRGQVFVPAHLRTLFVPRDVQFFDQSLTRNLTVGCPHFGGEDVPRLRSILRDLHLEKLLGIVEEELGSEAKMSGRNAWSAPLSRTDLEMLSLARALLADPDVLVVVNLFAGFDQSRAKDVADVLVEHVRNRGLHMPADGAPHRHPRTVFYSAEDPLPHACADVLWVMTETGELNSHGNPIWTVSEAH